MPISLAKVGTFLGDPVTEVEFTRHPDADGPHLLCGRRVGNQVTFSYWWLPGDGSLNEFVEVTKPGGMNLALATYDEGHALVVHRTSANGPLMVEAWRTGGFFEFDDDQAFVADLSPEILMYGAPVPPPAVFSLAAVRPVAAKIAPAGGTTAPGSTPGLPPQGSGKVKAVGTLGATISAKAGRAIVGSLTTAGQLRLSAWGFDAGGQVKMLVGKWAETLAGAAQRFSLAKVRELRSADGKVLKGVEFVTAVCDAGNHLRLRRWKFTIGTKDVPAAFEMLSEVVAPETVTLVSCCGVDALGGTQIVTAVSMLGTSPALKVIAWRMEANGGMTRLTEASGGGIDALQAAHVRGRVFVTATRETDQRFKANYWLFPNLPGDPLVHLGDAAEGKIGGWVKVVHVPGAAQQMGSTVFVTKAEDGKLQLWRYAVTEA